MIVEAIDLQRHYEVKRGVFAKPIEELKLKRSTMVWHCARRPAPCSSKALSRSRGIFPIDPARGAAGSRSNARPGARPMPNVGDCSNAAKHHDRTG